ncbi:hypothetical protein, partial [Candidatus Binatus sp.]|uniref:hypothetical protein n=1 Tax=Candidatus Binatus sp. TaxID=2811406 RepID=UPI003C86B7DA
RLLFAFCHSERSLRSEESRLFVSVGTCQAKGPERRQLFYPLASAISWSSFRLTSSNVFII